MKNIYLSLFTIFSIGINAQEVKDVFKSKVSFGIYYLDLLVLL